MNIKNPFSIYKGLPRGIYIIFVSRIIDNMGSVVMPMLTLIMTQKIGFSKSETGILITVAGLSQAPFLLWGGRLIDRIGSKKVIVVFNTLGAAAYIPCIFMKPHIIMAVFIALAADLFAVASPAYNAIVTEVVPKEKMKSAYSILYLGFNLGLAIGPALAGILFNEHLQLLFLIDAATCVISISLFYLFVPDNSHIKKQKEQEQPVNSGLDLNKTDSVNKFILHSRVLIVFSAVLLLYNFCYSQWNFMLPLQSASIFKASGAQYYSLLVSVNAIAVILFTPILTTLTHKFRPLAVVAAGGIFYTLSFLMFSGGQLLSVFIFAAVILTIGQIVININSNIFIAEQTPAQYIGRANSLLAIINGVGFAVGPLIMGQVLTYIDYSAAWLAVTALMILGVTGMFIINSKGNHEKSTSGL